MRRTLVFCLTIATTAASLAIAIPSEAATPLRAQAIRNQIDELDRRINHSDHRDVISEREAAGLRHQLDELQDLFRSYNANGLSNAEMNTLENRIRRLNVRLANERRDPGGRRG
jgi:predicted RNase H-like nuclease (RuvC/YqgF family)